MPCFKTLFGIPFLVLSFGGGGGGGGITISQLFLHREINKGFCCEDENRISSFLPGNTIYLLTVGTKSYIESLKELGENLPESFTSLRKNHEPHLTCVSLFLTCSVNFSKRSQKCLGCGFVPS